MTFIIEFIQGGILLVFGFIALLMSFLPSVILYYLLIKKSKYATEPSSELNLIEKLLSIVVFIVLIFILPTMVGFFIFKTIDPTGAILKSIPTASD